MIELLKRRKKLTVNQWQLICTANLADLLARLRPRCRPWRIFGGWLGDKIGRRTVFILSAVTIALVTCVVVFTPAQDGLDPGWLFLMFSASSSFLRPSRPARPLVALPLLGS